ncbi:hypothetical protein MPLA_1480009 [Mesorhizobium sp. ORS 3359]|nr:hypothetical protein MPLA_1480009 [Mesorhizobium sp. ORS 3359]
MPASYADLRGCGPRGQSAPLDQAMAGAIGGRRPSN